MVRTGGYSVCGIAGFLGPFRENEDRVATALATALTHRGPDGEGVQSIELGTGRRLALVHRRLAIIDLSPLGRQPMHDPVSGNWITYNGEIYNFQEVRAHLEQEGEGFRSRSDTEVLMRLMARKGLGALDVLQGMFAFALWDAAGRRLVLAVDPLGIKPLYWTVLRDGTFAFASEVRALVEAGLAERRLDPVGLEGYLAYGAVQGPATILDGVRSLQAGCHLVVDADGTVHGPHRYWRPPFAPPNGRPVRARVVEELSSLLLQVTREHLVADVPVAVFLSGGVDSTAMASFAAASTPALKSFSVTFKETEWSEASYSRATAARLGLDHEELVLRPDELLAQLPAALDAMDQPSVDGTNVFVLSRLVRQAGLTVALSGQGGDEVFGGYSTFSRVRTAVRWRRRLSLVPSWTWRAGALVWNAVRSRRRALPDKFGQFLGGSGGVIETTLLLRQLFPPATVRQLLPREQHLSLGLPEELEAEFRCGTTDLDPVNAVSLLELRGYLGQTLLRDGDAMSMAHGLEVRVPYLDRRVVDYVAALPGAMKLEAGRPKPLLLDAAKGGVPEGIWARPKQGFTFPWEEWLRGPLKPLGEETFSDRSTLEHLGLDASKARALWDAFLVRRPGISWSRVWALIALREWTVRQKVTA